MCYARGPEKYEEQSAGKAWNTRADVSPWVAIEDIPKDWMDGRPLLLLTGRGDTCLGKYLMAPGSANWSFGGYATSKGGYFYWTSLTFTHAMLPVEPPK